LWVVNFAIQRRTHPSDTGRVVDFDRTRDNLVQDSRDTAQGTPETARTLGGIGALRLGAVLVLAAAAAFVGWRLLVEDDTGSTAPGNTATVSAASLGELEGLPASLGHPVYWAGARKSFTYELTETREGNIFIRYLPPGVPLEDKRPDYLTVGTYPVQEAIGAAREQARQDGAFRRSIAGNGIAYSLPNKPRSVYFTYPRLDYLYEVYDPRPLRARRLVLSGRVRPID
jgi:hypothetical protein